MRNSGNEVVLLLEYRIILVLAVIFNAVNLCLAKVSFIVKTLIFVHKLLNQEEKW